MLDFITILLVPVTFYMVIHSRIRMLMRVFSPFHSKLKFVLPVFGSCTLLIASVCFHSSSGTKFVLYFIILEYLMNKSVILEDKYLCFYIYITFNYTDRRNFLNEIHSSVKVQKMCVFFHNRKTSWIVLIRQFHYS